MTAGSAGRHPVVPRLSVVICSLNGAAGVERCLCALEKQTIRAALQLVVVDDGSTDGTDQVGYAHGAEVVRHPVNRGLAVARNSGLEAAAAPIVAFLDDDCEPGPEWAELLLSGYQRGVLAVGGPMVPAPGAGFMAHYLERNNPFRPQEAELAHSNRLLYRLFLYLRRQWRPSEDAGRREVYSLTGGNMSFVRQAVLDAGRFDERFRFGAEELDLCIRLRRTAGQGRLIFLSEASVVHHFKAAPHSERPTLRDTLRRSRAYGRGAARLYRKWPPLSPTLFPWPVLVVLLLLLSVQIPLLALAAIAAPQVLYPGGLQRAVARRSGACLLDAYVQLAQEACGNLGFLEGLWLFRHLVPEPDTGPWPATTAGKRTGLVP